MKMTDRSAKWMETVTANCEANTGRTLAQWVAAAKKARPKDAKAARTWAKDQGLSIVYQTAVTDVLFPEKEDDGALVDAQYAGPKAPLRPIYDAIVSVAKALGNDVEVMPRKSQVTLSRATTFAIVRAPARDRVEVLLKLHGDEGTLRLVANAKAGASDPSHAVAVRDVTEVDKQLARWLRKAYERAAK
jgi:hypothetical protein